MKTKDRRKSCTLADLLFPVSLNVNPRRTNRRHSRVVTGIIGGSEIDLNYCSPIYELVPNEQIFPKVEEIFRKHGIAFSVKYSHTNNVHFYADYVIEDTRYSYIMKGTNDVIKFLFSFQHSYDGAKKYRGEAGFRRLVCTNGLTAPVMELKRYNLIIEGKHTKEIIHSLVEFDALLTNVANNMAVIKNALTNQYESLGGRWIADPKKRVEEVLKATKITAVENAKFNTINDILNRIVAEADNKSLGYNGKVNDWLIYNGINQYVNDDNRNIADPDKRRETDRKVLEYMLENA